MAIASSGCTHHVIDRLFLLCRRLYRLQHKLAGNTSGSCHVYRPQHGIVPPILLDEAAAAKENLPPGWRSAASNAEMRQHGATPEADATWALTEMRRRRSPGGEGGLIP
jgi:hypothetical protein